MVFEHVANATCLELANSAPDRRVGGARDWLREPASAAAWAQSLGMPLGEEPGRAELAELVGLREAVFAVFAATARGETAPAAALDRLAREQAEGLRRYGYVATGTGFARAWPERWSASALRAAFADSAAAELVGERLDRVKICPSCDWLFIDTSRNRSRRWCSMEMCGSRDKSLRHYRRRRDELAAG